ncbi:hypothetical protein CYMTET_20059, partial [Cymbomonas tetramitiformis]
MVRGLAEILSRRRRMLLAFYVAALSSTAGLDISAETQEATRAPGGAALHLLSHSNLIEVESGIAAEQAVVIKYTVQQGTQVTGELVVLDGGEATLGGARSNFTEGGLVRFDFLVVTATPGSYVGLRFRAADGGLSPVYVVHVKPCKAEETFLQGRCRPEDVRRSLSVDDCPEGHVKDSDEEECRACSRGSFKNESGFCTPCDLGTYSELGGTDSCTECPVGHFASELGSTSCSECPSGYSQEEMGQASCNICPSGYYSALAGSATCNKCEPGTYTDIEGMEACLGCPEHTSNRQAGNVERIGTSAGDIYELLSKLEFTSVEDCLPEPGYYGIPGQPAKPCPTGGVCCNCEEQSFKDLNDGLDRLTTIVDRYMEEFCFCLSGISPYPFSLYGYMRSEEEGYEDNFLECPNQDLCLGSIATTIDRELILLQAINGSEDDAERIQQSDRVAPYTYGHCDTGYTGRLCKRCSSNYRMVGGGCLECPEVSYYVQCAATALSLCCVVLTWWFLGVYLAGNYESLNQLLLYLQVGSMVNSFSMDWPYYVQIWAGFLGAVNFDVDVISPQCVLPGFGYHNSFYLQMTLPLLTFAGCAVDFLWDRWKLQRDSSLNEATRAAVLYELFNQKVAIVVGFQ